MVIANFPELKANLRTKPPKTAVVAAAHDKHTLQAVFAARRDGLIRPILVGDKGKILSIAQDLGEDLEPDNVVDAGDDIGCAAASVALIRAGEGTMLIKGMLQTGILLKAVVNRGAGIRTGEVMSHVAILDVPSYHKLLYVTDGGMVVAPTLEKKRHILRNAVDFCCFLGYDCPKAAALCAVETAEGARGDFGACLVEGPISLDLATNGEAARVKGYQSPVAGDADILLAPSIAAGNLLGKSLYGLAGGEMAGVVLGAKVPITVNSRGAAAEEKYWSILICAAMN